MLNVPPVIQKSPEQSKRNETRIRDEHRKIDGFLTSAEIAQLRERFKVTQSQAAQIFGDRGLAGKSLKAWQWIN